MNRTLATVASLVALTSLITLPAAAAGIYKPEDSNGVIAGYELLGVRIGMSEGDAIAQIKKRFPASSKDANDRPINLQQSDYVLTSPTTRAKVKAGIRFDLHPQEKSNLNFVKIFVHEGRVWGIWRDDAGGKYEYQKMVSDMNAKYRGAAEIKSAFMIVNGGSIASQPGDPAIDGVHLFEGQCLDFPFTRRGHQTTASGSTRHARRPSACCTSPSSRTAPRSWHRALVSLWILMPVAPSCATCLPGLATSTVSGRRPATQSSELPLHRPTRLSFEAFEAGLLI